MPRSVSAQGRDAIGYALGSLFAAGVIVLLVMIVALRRMVLTPVSRDDAIRRCHRRGRRPDPAHGGESS